MSKMNEILLKYFSSINKKESLGIMSQQVCSEHLLNTMGDGRIDANYISGLVHADGSFFFNFYLKTSLQIRCNFSLTLHKNSREALEIIKAYFGNCGVIYENTKKGCVEYKVTLFEDLNSYIIPHFEKYPMCGRKNIVFKQFIKICNDWKNIQDKTIENNLEIIEKIVNLNYTHSLHNKNYSKKKNKVEIALNTKIKIPEIQKSTENQVFELTDQFIIGLIDGDGCFSISFNAPTRLRFAFQITGDLEQKELFLKIKKKFNCGSIQQEGSNTLKYRITGRKQIIEKIIPFMDNPLHKLYTWKKIHYANLFLKR